LAPGQAITVTEATGRTVTYTREQWTYQLGNGIDRGKVEKRGQRGWFSRWGKWAVTVVLIPIILALIEHFPEIKASLKGHAEGCQQVEAGDPMRAVYSFDGQAGSRVMVEVGANGSVGTNGGGRQLSLAARVHSGH
jgi:hypothetical protein